VTHDREVTWTIEYGSLRARGYGRAEAARLATLHTLEAAASPRTCPGEEPDGPVALTATEMAALKGGRAPSADATVRSE
jgi:hypothetical protein